MFSRRAFWQALLGVATALSIGPAEAGGKIDESGFVRIGGINQWIAIQGRDDSSPVILFLHGGPGEAQSPFLSQFKPLESDFTVVNWDQRGAGKTFEKNGITTPDLTLDRVTSDAIELAEYIRKRLKKKKLLLVGQSAGTVIGLKIAQRRPDLFYAFVGTGQFVSMIRTAEWQEKQTDIPATHDAAELKALHQWAILSPPDQPYMHLMMEFLGSPEKPKPEAETWLAGYHFESSKIGKETEPFDAMIQVNELALPYIQIQGREDRITPFAVANDYFDHVRSNGKVFVPINGGHYACFTNADEFLTALRRHVLPIIARER